jgi:hypothetical protein
MTQTTKSPAATYRAKMLRNRNRFLMVMLRRLRREQECKEANACCDKTDEKGKVYRSTLLGRGQRGTGMNHFDHS